MGTLRRSVLSDLTKAAGSGAAVDHADRRQQIQEPGSMGAKRGQFQGVWGKSPRYERHVSENRGQETHELQEPQEPQENTQDQVILEKERERILLEDSSSAYGQSGGSETREGYVDRENQRPRESVADQRTQESSPEDSRQSRDYKSRKSPKHRENRKQRLADEVDTFEREEYSRRREIRKQEKRGKAMENDRKKEEAEQAPSPIYLPPFISVSTLADVIGIPSGQFIRQMEQMGFEDVTYNHILDAENAGLVAAEYNFEPIFDTPDEDLVAAPEPEDKSALPQRPPVVTIMGHVDHGKTTILDWLRKSSVVASEHGGITQHIGAFSVSMPSGKMITFLDTPGHEAFLDMRRRGADVTDVVILVVAADDSVKPQTVEAIKHATSSKVPIIVAMSKIDKPGTSGEKVKQDLSVQGVHVEDYGGDVQAIGVSGKTGQGMVELEEAVITLSDVLDLRADNAGNVEGWVIEASTKSYGRVATVLVRRGTLRQGDIIVAGSTWSRVRSLRNEAGVAIEKATPGTAVEIDGWREQPGAGTEILQAPDEQRAKDVVEMRQEKTETEKLGEDTAAMNKERHAHLEKRRLEAAGIDPEETEEEQTGPKKVNFVIKADVGGSAEAVMNSVAAVGNAEIYANVVRSGVGQVNESDVEHAASANGHVICFNLQVDPNMVRLAEKRGVRVLDHNVIYSLVDDVREAVSAELPPTLSHRVLGEAEISKIFEINVKRKVNTAIAGCKVRNGSIKTSKKVRVLRGQETVYDGKFDSIRLSGRVC